MYNHLVAAWNSSAKPRIVKDSPVREMVEEPRLSKIPVLTHFEKDVGSYITSAIVSARSPDKKVENVSVHRLQVLDDKHLAIRLVPSIFTSCGAWRKRQNRTWRWRFP
ncbi:MAG: UbiD family decarboxylase [Candidatus Bathyarchaeota archaeon]|nr:UbiD family decarboxylase [Candidatus Bathyarchaeota archaeon]